MVKSTITLDKKCVSLFGFIISDVGSNLKMFTLALWQVKLGGVDVCV